MTLGQVAIVFVSLLLAAMPAMPAYFAVSLLLPPMILGDQAVDSLEILHTLTSLALAASYLATVLTSALHASCRSTDKVADTLRSLELAQRLAREFCRLATWLYLAVALHRCTMHLLLQEQSTFGWWLGAAPTTAAG